MRWFEIDGWFSEQDAGFVTALCRRTSGMVLEIGVFKGRSTAVMAPVCLAAGRDYHVVDNFWGTEECDPATVAQRSEKVLTAFRRNMKSLGLWDRITVHKSDSYAATAAFRDASLGLCFIDADHTFEGCVRDLESWWPKVRPGGVLAGHDYSDSRRFTVRPAVDSFVASGSLRLEHGRARRRSQRHVCWAIRKPV